MRRNRVTEYINSIRNNRSKLIELNKATFRYKMLVEQFGQNFVDDAIIEIGKEKGQENLSDLELFLAYEEEIEKKIRHKHADYAIRPIKEIESKDINGLVKRYNTTSEVAQIIIDFKITDPYISAELASIILKFNIKDNPNALVLARIIHDNRLNSNQNGLALAEIILKYNLKDNPEALKISNFIVTNNLGDNTDAVKIYYFIKENNLENNPDAAMIANRVIKLGISLDLSIEVSRYNHYNYAFEQSDEKYILDKLRQFYQIKLKTEPDFNMQKEIERIMMVAICADRYKAEGLLMCCLGENWGKNSSYYWDHDKFKKDYHVDSQVFTEEEIRSIQSYTQRPDINNMARKYKVWGGRIYSIDEVEYMTSEMGTMFHKEYSKLYDTLNKHSLSKDVVVLRNTSIDSLEKYSVSVNDSEEEIKKKLRGYYHDDGFVSTSSVITKEGVFGGEVCFIINLKAGTPCGEISRYSYRKEECEILIPPNVSFTVNDVKKIDGKIMVYLTSIPTKSLSYVGTTEEEIDGEKSEGRHL